MSTSERLPRIRNSEGQAPPEPEIHRVMTHVFASTLVEPSQLAWQMANLPISEWGASVVATIGKNNQSTSANQIVFPGAEKRDNETWAQATRRTLTTELNAENVRVLPDNFVSVRSYFFNHRGKVQQNDVYTGVAYLPPFVRPSANDPREKAQQTVLLTPSKLEQLTTSETIDYEGNTYYLLESLRKSAPSNVYRSTVETDIYKDYTVGRAYLEETLVRLKILDNMFTEGSIRDDYRKTKSTIVRRINRMIESGPNSEDAKIIFQEVNDYFIRGAAEHTGNAYDPEQSELPPDYLKRIQLAYEQVYLEESLRFILPGTPQSDYLVAQAVGDMSEISPKQLRQIRKHAPVLHALLTSMAQSVSVETTSENWFGALQVRLAQLRDFKLGKSAQTADLAAEFDRFQQTLSEVFFKKFGISAFPRGPRPHNFGEYAAYADQFYNQLQELYKDFLTPELTKQLFLSTKYIQNQPLENLVMLMMGVNPVDDADTTNEIRWQATKKLLTIARIPPLLEVYKEKRDNYPAEFYAALNSMIDLSDTQSPNHEGKLQMKGYLRTGKQIVIADGFDYRASIDYAQIPLYILDDNKSFVRFFAKTTERDVGYLGQDIRDVHRLEITIEPEAGVRVATQDDMWPMESVLSDRMNEAAKNVMTELIAGMLAHMAFKPKPPGSDSSPIHITNIRASRGNTRSTDLTDVLSQAVFLGGLIEGHDIIVDKIDSHGGSIGKRDYRWLKLVKEYMNQQIEAQFFPGQSHHYIKHTDDYTAIRGVIPATKGWYSQYATHFARDGFLPNMMQQLIRNGAIQLGR